MTAYDDDLSSAQDGSAGFLRPNLACLFENDHVEGEAIQRKIAGHGQRSHHEPELDVMDGVFRLFQQLADGHVPPDLLELAQQNAHLPDIAVRWSCCIVGKSVKYLIHNILICFIYVNFQFDLIASIWPKSNLIYS